jgi:hypothetical protein
VCGRFSCTVTHRSKRPETIALALTISGLSKTYPNGVKALKDLSLTIGNNMFALLARMAPARVP